jgi:hypothetical protein
MKNSKKPGMYWYIDVMYIYNHDGSVELIYEDKFEQIPKEDQIYWQKVNSSDRLVWEF